MAPLGITSAAGQSATTISDGQPLHAPRIPTANDGQRRWCQICRPESPANKSPSPAKRRSPKRRKPTPSPPMTPEPAQGAGTNSRPGDAEVPTACPLRRCTVAHHSAPRPACHVTTPCMDGPKGVVPQQQRGRGPPMAVRGAPAPPLNGTHSSSAGRKFGAQHPPRAAGVPPHTLCTSPVLPAAQAHTRARLGRCASAAPAMFKCQLSFSNAVRPPVPLMRGLLAACTCARHVRAEAQRAHEHRGVCALPGRHQATVAVIRTGTSRQLKKNAGLNTPARCMCATKRIGAATGALLLGRRCPDVAAVTPLLGRRRGAPLPGRRRRRDVPDVTLGRPCSRPAGASLLAGGPLLATRWDNAGAWLGRRSDATLPASCISHHHRSRLLRFPDPASLRPGAPRLTESCLLPPHTASPVGRRGAAAAGASQERAAAVACAARATL